MRFQVTDVVKASFDKMNLADNNILIDFFFF